MGLHLYLTNQDVLLGKYPKKWVFYEYLSEISTFYTEKIIVQVV